MRIGTLFSGIGSPEQGASRVYNDLDLVFACEWDKYARESFNANYKIEEKHFHKDIADMDGTQYKDKIDILIGGSPCQDFSLAGLRKGIDGNKGILIYEYIRIIKETQPPIFIYENVKGMLSDKNGRTVKEFVAAFRDMGYNCHYEVINTKDYGVPQNRERIFLVGFKDVEHYYNFSFAPKMKLEKRLKDVLESAVDEKYYVDMLKNKRLIKTFNNHKGSLENGTFIDSYNNSIHAEYSACLSTRTNASNNSHVFIETNNEDDICNCLTTMGEGNREPKVKIGAIRGLNQVGTLKKQITKRQHDTPIVCEQRSDEGLRFFNDNVCGTLRTIDCCGDKRVIELNQVGTLKKQITKRQHDTPKEINQFLKDHKGNKTLKQIAELTEIKKTTIDHYFRIDKSRAIPSPTDWEKLKEVLGFDNTFDTQVKDTFSKQSTFESTARVYDDNIAPTLTCNEGSTHLVETRIRKLTPRECFRLQDFPDTFKFVVSNSQLYKQAGNSISANVMEMIFNQIEKSRNGNTNQNTLF